MCKVYVVLSCDDEGFVNIVKIFRKLKDAEKFRSEIEESDRKMADEIGTDPDIYYVREYSVN